MALFHADIIQQAKRRLLHALGIVEYRLPEIILMLLILGLLAFSS